MNNKSNSVKQSKPIKTSKNSRCKSNSGGNSSSNNSSGIGGRRNRKGCLLDVQRNKMAEKFRFCFFLYLYSWSHHKNVSWSIKGRSQILKRRLRQIFRKRGYFSAEYILTLPIIITTGSWTWDTSNIIDTEQAGRETLLRKFQGSKNSFNKNHINKIGKYLTNFV